VPQCSIAERIWALGFRLTKNPLGTRFLSFVLAAAPFSSFSSLSPLFLLSFVCAASLRSHATLTLLLLFILQYGRRQEGVGPAL
jgi:hypothetical protein